jgi:transposase
MSEVIRIGVDTSKSVFQLHGVDAAERPVLLKKLRRGEMRRFFGALPATVIGLEACGGAHYWARVLQELGHEVRLLPPQYVKPYVKRGKNDAADAPFDKLRSDLRSDEPAIDALRPGEERREPSGADAAPGA